MKTLSRTLLVSLVLIVFSVLGSFGVVSVTTLVAGVVLMCIATGLIILTNVRAAKAAPMPVIYDNSSR